MILAGLMLLSGCGLGGNISKTASVKKTTFYTNLVETIEVLNRKGSEGKKL